MTVKLIAIDMDATLLRDDKSFDHPRFKDIHQQLCDQGHVVCIASGNSYPKLIEFFDDQDRQKLYFASDNGNYIVKENQVLETIGLTKDQLLTVADYLDEVGGYHLDVSTGSGNYFREANGKAYDHIKRYNPNVTYIKNFQELPDDSHIVKIAVLGYHPLDHLKQTVSQIKAQFGDFCDAVTSGDHWIDIYHRQGGKGSGIQYLQDKYQISPAETMVFGDSMNDRSMMLKAHYGVAMGNADSELLKYAGYQIGTNQDQAVLTVLAEYLKQGNLAFLEAYKR
ncbi:HAD family hydrolase [Vaginisenegalia massiliensis]|uniref:HAD family hydrolase n=1 Tax=Vaginisenegalia massiliensis TaxID=2058294 RepID=UPI000F53031A|nr:HAD family hydrolase [Vaginisenegalia massiliensis]